MAAEEVLALNQAQNYKTVKMLIGFDNIVGSEMPINEKLVALFKELCIDAAQFYLTDKGKLIQIMAQSVNKLNSVEKIRRAFEFEKDEIAVFGDDVNDREMLSEYKYSIAMGNAEREIKDIAKYETTDNNNDGIHYAIRNILHVV